MKIFCCLGYFPWKFMLCPFSCSSHSDHVFDVAWSPTAEFLVTASHDHLWKLWLPKSPLVGYISSSKFSQVENLRVTQSIFPDNVTTWSIWHRKWSKVETFNFLICIDWNENIPVRICMFMFILLLFVYLLVSWQRMLESQLFGRKNLFPIFSEKGKFNLNVSRLQGMLAKKYRAHWALIFFFSLWKDYIDSKV